MDLKNLLEILPDIVLYIASGYLFIFIFCFISLRKKLNDIQGVFIISLVVGFILKTVVCAVIPVRFGFYVNTVGFLIICAFLGGIAGYTVESSWFRKILTKLRISRSVHENIWHDIIDVEGNTMWIRAVSREKEQVIIGILVLVEEFQRYPLLVLQQYRVYDLEGKLIEDYIQNANHQIIIKSEYYDTIDVVYDEESSHYKNIEVGGVDDV